MKITVSVSVYGWGEIIKKKVVSPKNTHSSTYFQSPCLFFSVCFLLVVSLGVRAVLDPIVSEKWCPRLFWFCSAELPQSIRGRSRAAVSVPLVQQAGDQQVAPLPQTPGRAQRLPGLQGIVQSKGHPQGAHSQQTSIYQLKERKSCRILGSWLVKTSTIIAIFADLYRSCNLFLIYVIDFIWWITI